MQIPWLHGRQPFPPIETALRDPNGLLAAGGDLSPQRLIDAYRRGIFPWFNEDEPPLWWCPDPRMVMFSAERRIARSLAKVIRSGRFQVTMDTAFAEVMLGCSEPRPRQEGTWITPAIIAAYTELFRLGYAHSVEAWEHGDLVGGLYGVSIGRMFFGESMFARRSDASKVALITLLGQLERWNMPLIDCQVPTNHLASLGAREIPREEFLSLVHGLVQQPAIPAPWAFDASGGPGA